jgi:hypothetical protein
MKTTDEQLRKLPKYAQDEISWLRREVDRLKGELVAQQCDTPSRVKWGYDSPTTPEAFGYLPDDRQVEFSVGDRPRRKIRIELMRECDGVRVNADGTLKIECRSSNHITIRLRP